MILQSSSYNYTYNATWYNRGAVYPQDPLVCVNNYPSSCVYFENSETVPAPDRLRSGYNVFIAKRYTLGMYLLYFLYFLFFFCFFVFLFFCFFVLLGLKRTPTKSHNENKTKKNNGQKINTF